MTAMDAKTRFLLALLDIGAVQFGQFRLKLHEHRPDAPLSPVYIDLRLVRRFPTVKDLALDLYEELTRNLQFDVLADIPTAATPFVSSLSDRLGVGMISPRLSTKSYGMGTQVDGLLPEDSGRTALLIDDVITGADSKLEAAGTLERAGVRVRDIVVLVDREQGGTARLSRQGYRVHSAFTLGELLTLCADAGRIEANVIREIRRQLRSVQEWTG